MNVEGKKFKTGHLIRARTEVLFISEHIYSIIYATLAVPNVRTAFLICHFFS